MKIVLAAAAAMTLIMSTFAVFAQDDEGIAPAPAAIGADVPLTYFGPQPSQVKRELVGAYQELKSGKIDLENGTITLPLYEGAMKTGQIVWYIVTDTDDKGNADQLGLNYSPKLTFRTSADRFARRRWTAISSWFLKPARSISRPSGASRLVTLRISFRPSSSSQVAWATRIIRRW